MENVFIRHEQKYILSCAGAKELRGFLRPHMQEDDYGRQTLCSLYLDSEDFAAFRGKELKQDYREKLRLRSYGVPLGDTLVFFELKKKVRGVSYKRRMALPLAAAAKALETGQMPRDSGQVGGEVQWFLARTRPAPKAVICYDRVALYGREEPGLRLTLDENLRCRGDALALAQGDWGHRMLGPGQVLVEIKVPGALPLWLAEALSERGLYPTSYSKYHSAAQNGFYTGGNAHAV